MDSLELCKNVCKYVPVLCATFSHETSGPRDKLHKHSVASICVSVFVPIEKKNIPLEDYD